jgi:hypothetical protein
VLGDICAYDLPAIVGQNDQAVESKQTQPTRPLPAKNVQLVTEGEVL